MNFFFLIYFKESKYMSKLYVFVLLKKKNYGITISLSTISNYELVIFISFF